MNINTSHKAWGLAGLSFIAGLGLIGCSSILFGKVGALGFAAFAPGILLYGGGCAFGIHKWTHFLIRQKEEDLKKIRAFENSIPLIDMTRNH